MGTSLVAIAWLMASAAACAGSHTLPPDATRADLDARLDADRVADSGPASMIDGAPVDSRRVLADSGWTLPPPFATDAGVADADAEVVEVGDAGVGDASVGAGDCEPATPLEVFDRFLLSLLDSAVVSGSVRWAYDDWAYTRERVAGGALALDPVRSAECVSWFPTRVDSPWNSGSPCATALRPRCPAPAGTPCGHNFDCDPGLVCHGWTPYALEPFSSLGDPFGFATWAECRREGVCGAPIPVGGECSSSAQFVECAPPTRGFPATGCLDNPYDTTWGESHCVDVSHPTSTDHCDSELLPDPRAWQLDGSVSIAVCPAGSLCEPNTWRCWTPLVDQGLLWPCHWDTECRAGLACVARFCGASGTVPCTTTYDCGPTVTVACSRGVCVVTDGSRGAPCDERRRHQCLPGLHCRDGRCGDLLALGAVCEEFDHTSCASGCCDTALGCGLIP